MQRFRANLLTWGMILLDQGRKAKQLSALDRAPPSSWPWFLELKNGLGLGVRIPPVPGSGLAHKDGGKLLTLMGSPPLGLGPSTPRKLQKLFFFFGTKKAELLTRRQSTADLSIKRNFPQKTSGSEANFGPEKREKVKTPFKSNV